MKKLSYLLLPLLLLLLGSCRKDYSCSCETVNANMETTVSVTLISNVSKSTAEDACELNEFTGDILSITTCTLSD